MSPDPEPPPLPPALPLAETVALDQAGTAITTPPAGGGPTHSHCENCGAKLAGPYCHHCGQHDFDLHRSFRHVFLEALDTLFNLEGRFFRSIITLLFRPGRLTAEFNAGKRVAQMPPFRLYIFVSFLLFLIIFLGGPGDQFVRTGGQSGQEFTVTGPGVTFGTGSSPDATPVKATAPKATNPVPPESPRLVDRVRATADEARTQADEKLGDRQEPAVVRDLDARLKRIADPEFRERLTERIQTYMPHMLMLCLPCFAFYTRVLFRKSGLMYLQHLVLALHFHTFVYLWLLCRKGWVGLADLPGWGLGGWVTLVCNLWLWGYLLVMLRRLFANSWPWTVFKTFALTFVYSLTVGIGFMLMAVVAVLLA